MTEPRGLPVSAPSDGHRPTLDRYGLSGWDAISLVAVVLLVVAFAPPLIFDAWTARMAVILGVAPLGLACVVVLLRHRDRAAVLLTVALAWTVSSAFVSGSIRSAMLGSVGRDLSALVVVAGTSVWAVGRRMSDRGRSLLPAILVVACSVNAAVGILQVLGDVTSGPLAMYFGRPTGFSVNPVYFGALCAAGLVVAVDRWSRAAWTRWTVPVLLLGVGVNLSGSRVALLATVLTVACRLATRRTVDTAAASVLAVASLSLGVVTDRTSGSGRNAADRLVSASDGGGGGRTSVWRYGLESVADRPVFGFGFGRFRAAVQGQFSVDFTRVNAPDDLGQAWFDAHNVVIALLVAVGVIGTVLYLAWALDWARRLRGPLVWALLALALHWMLQPVSIVTLPVAMVLFGAAAPEPEATRAEHRPAVPMLAVRWCGALGALIALLVLVADLGLRRAADTGDGGLAKAAAIVYLRDPVVSDVVAQVVSAQEGGVTDESLRWHQRAVDAEPDRPYWWTQLARAQLELDDVGAARRSVNEALRLQPTNVRALRVSAFVAIAEDDIEALTVAFDRLCDLGEPECDLDPAEVMESVSG